jgi:hypothetical protein
MVPPESVRSYSRALKENGPAGRLEEAPSKRAWADGRERRLADGAPPSLAAAAAAAPRWQSEKAGPSLDTGAACAPPGRPPPATSEPPKRV